MTGWHLPTIADVKAVASEMDKFKYKTDGYYHSQDSFGCRKQDYSDPIHAVFSVVQSVVNLPANAIESVGSNCIYHFTKDKDYFAIPSSTKNHIRCVLDPEAYNTQRKVQLEEMRRLRSLGTYTAYVKAYRIGKDPADLKNAYKAASTEDEKRDAERLLVNEMKEKIFDISLTGEERSKTKVMGRNTFFLTTASGSGKDIVKHFTLSSRFPLQYNSYRVTVSFVLNLVYRQKTLLQTSTEKTQKRYSVTYMLNRANGYKDTKSVRFKEVITSLKGGAFGINMIKTELIDASIAYEIGEIL